MRTRRGRQVAAVATRLLAGELQQVFAPETDDHEDLDRGGGRRQRRARGLRVAMEELGPFFVKIGQVLSTRPDLVSTATVAELEKLHDTVSPAPFAEFEPVLAAELGPRWRRCVRDIDTEHPLGTASLAQVYRVTLANGRAAVIKVQRPGVRGLIESDMALFRRAARVVAKSAPRFNAVVDGEAMLGAIFDAIRPELDFTLEAENMEQGARQVVGFRSLTVPEVLMATPRVLVQSLAPGRSIRDTCPEDFSEQERRDIARDLLAFMYRGYFITRTFHADPHPGNILLHPGEPAALIDWGMIGRIDRRMSMALTLILLGLVQNDGVGVAKAWTEMGHITPWADLAGFSSDMTVLIPKISGASLQHLNFGTALASILKHSTRRGIQTSPVIPILAKSFANMEGSIRYLYPDLSVTEVFGEELIEVMFHLAGEALSEPEAARLGVELLLGANSLPQDLRRVSRDMSNREMTVQVAQVPGKPPSMTLRRHKSAVVLSALAFGLGLRVRLTRDRRA